MSLAEIETKVLALSEDERRQFVSWFYDHESEIAGPSADGDDDLGDEQKAELVRRAKEIEEHPEIILPFEEGDVVKMFDEFAHAHAKATPPRQS